LTSIAIFSRTVRDRDVSNEFRETTNQTAAAVTPA